MRSAFKMKGFSGFGNSPAKQKKRNIGEELKKKYKGKPQTTTKSGEKVDFFPGMTDLTQEERSDIIDRGKYNPYKPGSPKIESTTEKADVTKKMHKAYLGKIKDNKL